MEIDDIFKIQPEEPIKMSQKKFFERTKTLLAKIYSSYSDEWHSKALTDEEYPEETVCDKCKGCGVFTKDGEEKECFQDREQGECYYRFCDYEEVGINLEAHLEGLIELLCIDEIDNTNEQTSKG